ncbi:S24 family peptidase [Peptostreptococcus faecalis]|uniref:S24 family peptidase n=1 Tax=Peptostreptococcus faecalis TaxID=2045015 RepID=UPI000C7D5870|nr:S24 family peptidase [Peptostreptococcus faecalis]
MNIIEKRRLELGYNKKLFAKLVGVSEMTVTRWESGDVENMKSNNIISVANVLQISPLDILSINNQGQEFKKERVTEDINYVYDKLPISVAAGIPLDYESGYKFEKMHIPDDILGKRAGKKEIGIARVNGDSMNKDIPDGSWIIIDRYYNDLSKVKNNDIVLVKDTAGYTIKRIVKLGDRVVLKPNSTDDSFTDIIITKYNVEDFKLIGKVITYIVNL